MYLKLKNIFAALLFLLILNSTMYSQDLTNNLKYWSGLSLSYAATENLNAKISQMASLNVSPLKYSFSQIKISLSYNIRRRTYIEGGFVRGLFNYSNSLKTEGASSGFFNTLAVDRVYGNFSYKHDIINRLSLDHEIEFQYFIPDLNKYKTRTIYSTKLGYNVRKSSLAPYVKSQFYYYQGGAMITNGIKRLRLSTGLSFKPVKSSSMRVSVYYIFQNEFKTDLLSENDYTVIGSTISFRIK